MIKNFSMLSLLCFAFTSVAGEFSVRVIDNAGKPIENIVVYALVGSGEHNSKATSSAVVINQEDKQFSPYFAVIQRGTEVSFRNNDDITHHIYSAIGENRFSIKLKSLDDAKNVPFDHSGVVPMGCNIHDWMSGHLLVVDTPFFTQTNTDGVAVFDTGDLAPESVKVWHPQMAIVDRQKQYVFSAQQKAINITLTKQLKPAPEQKSLDDFDFLDDYE